MAAGELAFFVPSDRPGMNGRRKPWYGLNDIIDNARRNRFGYRRQKDDAEAHVARFARRAMEEQGWEMPEGRCLVTLTFVEPHGQRDPDNIYGGAKYVMDAICAPERVGRKRDGSPRYRHANGAGCIRDDSQRYVDLRVAICGEFDREAPGVWVRIRELPRETP